MAQGVKHEGPLVCGHDEERAYCRQMCKRCYMWWRRHPEWVPDPENPRARRARRLSDACGHPDSLHAGHGMCSSCHQYWRSHPDWVPDPENPRQVTRRWNGETRLCHPDRAHYRAGYCQTCYRATLHDPTVFTYVCRSVSGEVLYVGKGQKTRIYNHRAGTHWWPEVDESKLEFYEFASHLGARLMEMLLIARLRPRYNKEGVTV